MKNIFVKIDSSLNKNEIQHIGEELTRAFGTSEYNFIILNDKIDTMTNEELFKLFEKIYEYKKSQINDKPINDKQTTISDYDNTKC